MKNLLFTIAILFGFIIFFQSVGSLFQTQWTPKKEEQISVIPSKKVARLPKISISTPPHLNYDNTIRQMRLWEGEAKDFVDVIHYGDSTNGLGLYSLCITNKFKKAQSKVLITAAIHGDEPWSSGLIMAYAGNLLDSYGKNEQITAFLDNNEIHVIPIVSPDTYTIKRHVDDVDPNRNFPTRDNLNKKSIPPIENLKKYFLKYNFDAVLAGHCYGRIFLYPWGDTYEVSAHDDLYKEICGEMGRLSRYRIGRLCNNYPYLIYGVEVDWYYRHGAFAFVMEVGNHQRSPSMNEIKSEFDRTWKGFLYFLDTAPTILKR